MPMLNGGGWIGGWGLTGRVESHQSETPYVGERKKTMISGGLRARDFLRPTPPPILSLAYHAPSFSLQSSTVWKIQDGDCSGSKKSRLLCRLKKPRLILSSSSKLYVVDWTQPSFPLDCLWSSWVRKNSLLLVHRQTWFDSRRSFNRRILESLLHNLRHSTRPSRLQVRKRHCNSKNYSRDFRDSQVGESLDNPVLNMVVSPCHVGIHLFRTTGNHCCISFEIVNWLQTYIWVSMVKG